ncbi:MAG: hypothetical protein QNJ17_06655 [Desulfocapsaceae bacterium]|nr:hypothetical protein [Desulfocapsaceae bacterium]
MLDNKSFFESTGRLFPELILPDDYVWEPLNGLKEYMDNFAGFQPLKAPFQYNQPLEKTIVLHEGEVIEGGECKIVYGATTKGEMAIYHKDDMLDGASVIMAGACCLGDRLNIGKGVLIESGAMIKSPAIIGDFTEIRQSAYLRGYVLTGKGCVLGHATEIKHAIFLDNAKAGHFNYIGDSILGNNTNLGAGTKLANLRFIGGNVIIDKEGENLDTGRHKLGAILGDDSQTGCNSVTNPGVLLAKNTFVMPNTTVRSGYHKPGTFIR